ncbi:protein artemis isoform X3 [Phymastichus coffea]|nr:protein artemis isoform X3 [Phymastichus coffea]
MSTFLGLIEEIPGISIDCFNGKNSNSSAFFLSHCHQDHMKGLCYEFFDSLKKNNNYLYCSHISKVILQNYFFELDVSLVDECIKELPLDEVKIIEYSHNGINKSVTVSCISSGHCPGSIMILFTFQNIRILYTGDFRINKHDYSKLKSLHIFNGSEYIPLSIDKIYLDTTFLSLNFREFPCRLDSSKELCKTVKEWIDLDKKNIVILEISALYGSEFIYRELYKFLNIKIHVKDNVYKVYSRIDILSNCVTNLSQSTPIHACMNKRNSMKNILGLQCRPNVVQKNILTIVPSVWKWAGKNTSCISEWDTNRKQTRNICYSTHASYNELEVFIKYFKPKHVFACVCPENNKKEINDLLLHIMQKIYRNNTLEKLHSKKNSISFSTHKTFSNKKFKSSVLSDDEDT